MFNFQNYLLTVDNKNSEYFIISLNKYKKNKYVFVIKSNAIMFIFKKINFWSILIYTYFDINTTSLNYATLLKHFQIYLTSFNNLNYSEIMYF